MKKLIPALIGLLYIPFGLLLAWVASLGLLGTLVSAYIAFMVGIGLFLISKTIFTSVSKKNPLAEEAVDKCLLRSGAYLIPFIIIAFTARAVLGWSSMMPFIATGTVTYIATATSEVSKLGMKSMIGSLMPSLVSSLLIMLWTLSVGFLF